jgi:hypothetical protein
MTAYRQQALICAAALQAGPLRPRDLKRIAPDAGRILLRNVYGWFERIEPGHYRLAEAGAAALRRWTVIGDIPGSARSLEDATDVGSSVPPAHSNSWRAIPRGVSEASSPGILPGISTPK